MMIWKKHLPQILLVTALLCFSQTSLSQTTKSDEDDILDFMPAIIAATQQQSQIPPPSMPEPLVTGLGNFRIAKTETFNRSQPMGRATEFISSWDSSGNNVRDDLTVFDLFGGNPTLVTHTVVSNITYDDNNRPLTSRYKTMYTNGNQDIGSKQYRYQGGRLSAITTESTFTSDITGSVTTNINTVLQYGGNNRLIGAKVTISQPQSSVISTEQHTVSYDSNNRVKSHRVIRSSNITNTPEETLHSHRYDSTGNLIESVTITPTNVKAIWTFGPLIGNKSTGSIVSMDQSTGAVLSDSIIVGTYEVGVCTLRGPNDPYVIEGNITASRPYSPNIGCVKR